MTLASRAKPGSPLNPKELRVLTGRAMGGTKGAVAADLHISHHTVHIHTLNILARTKTERIEHALAVAIARGEIKIEAPPGEPEPRLEGRQIQILLRYAKGFSTIQVAEDTQLSLHTIKTETTKLYQELQAKTRVHLVYRGFETGNLVVNRRKKQ